MALLPNAANTEDNNQTLDDRSALPVGKYLAHIVKTEMKETKAKTGHYLNVHFKVLEPAEFAGRMFFTNLNLVNPNPVAVEIATKELNSIAQACNVQGVEDSEELHQVPMVVDLGIEAATSQFPESNKINSYADESEWSGESADKPADDKADDGRPWD